MRLSVVICMFCTGLVLAAQPPVEPENRNGRSARSPRFEPGPRILELLGQEGPLSRDAVQELNRLFDRLDQDRDGRFSRGAPQGPFPVQRDPRRPDRDRRRFAPSRGSGFGPRQPVGRPPRNTRSSPEPLKEYPADQQGVGQILAEYDKSLPTQRALSFYSLDWAEDLAVARRRAAKEKRPIFFIMVTNYSGPADFFSGHC